MIKDEIANAFQRHFHQFGFKKTAVDDVARELQISKKTIYQHFASKEEILQYVIRRSAQEFLVKMAAEIDPQAGEDARLEQLIRLIHKVAREFHASNISFALQFQIELAEAAYRQAYIQMIADVIAAGVAQGVFQVSSLETTTHYVNLLVGESLHLMLAQPEDPIVEETIRVVRKMLS